MISIDTKKLPMKSGLLVVTLFLSGCDYYPGENPREEAFSSVVKQLNQLSDNAEKANGSTRHNKRASDDAALLNNVLAVSGMPKRVTNPSEIAALEKKVVSLDSQIARDPNNIQAILARAESYIKLGKYDKASSDYQRLNQINPLFGDSYHHAGNLNLFALKNYPQAIESYTKAIQYCGSSLRVQSTFYRGLAYAQSGDYSAAVKDFDTVLKKTPNNQMVLSARRSALSKIR